MAIGSATTDPSASRHRILIRYAVTPSGDDLLVIDGFFDRVKRHVSDVHQIVRVRR